MYINVSTLYEHVEQRVQCLFWRKGSSLFSTRLVNLFSGSYWTNGSSWLSWSHHFERFTVTTMNWLTAMECLCHKWPLVVITSRSFPHSWLITGVVARITRRVPLVEQELLTLPEHMSSPPVFGRVRVTRSLVLSVNFVDRCLSFCP